MIVQCMGGNCKSREACAHYHAPQWPGREPFERLCGEKEEPDSSNASVTWSGRERTTDER